MVERFKDLKDLSFSFSSEKKFSIAEKKMHSNQYKKSDSKHNQNDDNF